MTAVDNLPERALMRDVVDSRFNVGEIALPLMLVVLLLVMIPALRTIADMSLYFMWGILALIITDIMLMWTRYKRLAAERIPGRPLKGMMFYGWNRQMSIRRWRIPAPRVKRGDKI